MARNLQLLAERLAAKNRRIDETLAQSPAPYESPYGDSHSFGLFTAEDRACARPVADPPRITQAENTLVGQLSRALVASR